MKTITISILAASCMISGCTLDLSDAPQPKKNPSIVYLNCPDQINDIEIYRDMSSIKLSADSQEIPFYKATAKDSSWTFLSNKTGVENRPVSVFLNRSNHTYKINNTADNSSFTCTIPNISDEPPAFTRDVLSDAARRDNEQQKEAERERKLEEAREKPILERARRKCAVYARDLSGKIRIKNIQIINAHPMGYGGLTMCIIRANDTMYGVPHIITITGRGSDYEYNAN